MNEELSTSPNSVLFTHDLFLNKRATIPRKDNFCERTLTLDEFVREIPKIVKKKKSCKHNKSSNCHEEADTSLEDRINKLFSQLVLSQKEWLEYQYFDECKNYTRNLIATDNVTFTLLLMCWNPGKESPIHDHPCDGCWMRVCEGSVQEKRFQVNTATDSLVCYSDNIYKTGQLAYMDDFMGYHQVGNPDKSQPAVTLHLYIPPFKKCKIWPNASEASKSSTSNMCYYTKYGLRAKCGANI